MTSDAIVRASCRGLASSIKKDSGSVLAVGCFMRSELTPAWLLEIGAAFEVTIDPIFGEQGSTVEKPLPPCIVSFVSMPQIRGLKRSWFNAMPLPALR
jgi:hypothetical protein